MYDINFVRKLVTKLALDGNYSICETCCHCPTGKSRCKYNNIDQCNASNVDYYAPNKEVIERE